MLAASSPAPRALASQSAAGPGSCCSGPLWGGGAFPVTRPVCSGGHVPSRCACPLWGWGAFPVAAPSWAPPLRGALRREHQWLSAHPPLRRLVPLLPSPRHTRSTSHARIIRLKCLYLNTGNQQRKSTKANTGSWKRSMKLTRLWAELTKKKRGKTQITNIGNEK